MKAKKGDFGYIRREKEKKNTDYADIICHSSGSVCGRRSGDRDE